MPTFSSIRRLCSVIPLAAVLAMTGCKSMHGDDDGETEVKIAMTDVPQNVRQAFERDHPGVTVKTVERETYKDGTVHYEFEFTDASGKKSEIEYSADGVKLEDH